MFEWMRGPLLGEAKRPTFASPNRGVGCAGPQKSCVCVVIAFQPFLLISLSGAVCEASTNAGLKHRSARGMV